MTSQNPQVISPGLLGVIGSNPSNWGSHERRAVYNEFTAWLTEGGANDARLGVLAKFHLDAAHKIEQQQSNKPSKGRKNSGSLIALLKYQRKFASDHEAHMLRADSLSACWGCITWKKKNPAARPRLKQIMTTGEIALLFIAKTKGSVPRSINEAIGIIQDGSRASQCKKHDVYKKTDEVRTAIRYFKSVFPVCAAFRVFVELNGIDEIKRSDHRKFRKNVVELLMLSKLISGRLERVAIKGYPFPEHYRCVDMGDIEFESAALQHCKEKYADIITW